MKPCPTVQRHPFFEKSYDESEKRHINKTRDLEKYLKCGAPVGDRKNWDLNPLYGFPTGHTSIRIFFLYCKDCKKELFKNPCDFCGGTERHTMDDAVLFEIDSNHDKAYERAKKYLAAVKNPKFIPS